jgi:O-antigen/teichoic acid export membrane protein
MVFNQEEYGQITELYSYVAILVVFLTFGLETAYFRYANSHNDPQKVFNTGVQFIIFISMIFIVLVAIFLKPVSARMGYTDHPEYIMMLVFIVSMDAVTALPFAWLRFHRKAKIFSSIRIAGVIINISINILLLVVFPKILAPETVHYFPYYLTTNVGLVFVANVIASLATLIMIIPVFKSFDFNFDSALLKKLLNYSLPVLVIGLAGMINEVADKLLMRHLLPDPATAESQLGIYGANYKLAVLMMLFIQMFRYAFEPFFFAEEKNKDSKLIYARVMNWFVAFTWLIFLGVTLNIDIFKYFVGPKFREGLIIVPIILAAKMFLGIFYNLSVWYKLTNKTLYGALIAILGAAITIILNIIFIPEYGYIGAAWANFACYLTMMIVSFFWGRKIFPVPYNVPKILIYSLVSLIIYFGAAMLPFENIYLKLSVNTLFIVIFVVFVLLTEKYNWFTKKNQ